jgi:ethanolamine utilization protein EutN
MLDEQLSLVVRTVLEVLNVLQEENGSRTGKAALPAPPVTDDRSGEKHMIQAKVIGSVWSSHKIDELTGHKLMLVRAKEGQEHSIVAIDRVGAGLGDTVLISFSRNGPIDAQIVAIVDPSENR